MLPWWLSGKEPPTNAGYVASIPGSRRFYGGGSGTPLQYSCLENPMGRGAWWATVQGGRKESDPTYRLNNKSVCITMVLSKFVPPAPSPTVATSLASTSVTPFPALQIGSSVPFF